LPQISRFRLPRAKRGAETYQRTPKTPQKIDVFLFILGPVPGGCIFLQLSPWPSAVSSGQLHA
jgi:hypothetical protein